MNIAVENIKTFFYFEPSFFLFVGKVGSFKLKSVSILFYMFANSLVQISRSILSALYVRLPCTSKNTTFLYKNTFSFRSYQSRSLLFWKYSMFFISNLFLKGLLSASAGWNLKLRFVGIGYKIYFSQNLLVLKLGYSHYVIYLLPYELSVIFLGRKKRSIMLSCSSQYVLSLVSKYIVSLRVPNVYTGKGIRLRGTIFVKKEGKRSQF